MYALKIHPEGRDLLLRISDKLELWFGRSLKPWSLSLAQASWVACVNLDSKDKTSYLTKPLNHTVSREAILSPFYLPWVGSGQTLAEGHGPLTTLPVTACHFRMTQGQAFFPVHKRPSVTISTLSLPQIRLMEDQQVVHFVLWVSCEPLLLIYCCLRVYHMNHVHCFWLTM